MGCLCLWLTMLQLVMADTAAVTVDHNDLSLSSMHSFCHTQGRRQTLEVFFESSSKWDKGRKTLVKQSLQAALDMALCAQRLIEQMADARTHPYSSVFTDFFAQSSHQDVSSSFGRAAAVLQGEGGVAVSDAVRKGECRCLDKATDRLELLARSMLKQDNCRDAYRLGAFVQRNSQGEAVRDGSGRPVVNICVENHNFDSFRLAFTILHEALHVSDPRIIDVFVTGGINGKAYGAEQCKKLAKSGKSMLENADSYVWFVEAVLKRRQYIQAGQRQYDMFRRFSS